MRAEVARALDGERLDRVAAMMTGRSRAEVAALLGAGAVRVDARVVTKGATRVRHGERIEIDAPAETPATELAPDPSVHVPVVHEDADLLVVDKPAGLVVHPGSGQREGTMVHGLLAAYPEIATVGEKDRPGIVHRLDKGTSGLLLVARTQEAYLGLVATLRARDVVRRYRALVWGHPAADAGLIDAPIGRSARDPTRMAVALRGKEARTRYDVVQRFDDPVSVTEVVCHLETGRTHQIRVHLASIGHPVVGDARYRGARESLPAPRPWLHAERLELAHPVTGARLELDSPLPPDLAQIRERLRPAR